MLAGQAAGPALICSPLGLVQVESRLAVATKCCTERLLMITRGCARPGAPGRIRRRNPRLRRSGQCVWDSA